MVGRRSPCPQVHQSTQGHPEEGSSYPPAHHQRMASCHSLQISPLHHKLPHPTTGVGFQSPSQQDWATWKQWARESQLTIEREQRASGAHGNTFRSASTAIKFHQPTPSSSHFAVVPSPPTLPPLKLNLPLAWMLSLWQPPKKRMCLITSLQVTRHSPSSPLKELPTSSNFSPPAELLRAPHLLPALPS